MASKKPTFFSQQGEDVYILKHFINKKNTSGVFVEVGALDGICYTNTGFLEQEFGFSGVLIEPSEEFEKLKHSRPECITVNKAITNEEGKVLFKYDWAMSGIKETLPWNRELNYHGNAKEYEVETVPLGKLLQTHNIQYVDFMSIDVEGGELDVLKSMDWSIPVYVICIELDGHNPKKDDACREILQDRGFYKHGRLGGNEFWVNDGYFRKTELFDENAPYIEFKKYAELKDLGNFICLEESAVADVHYAILVRF